MTDRSEELAANLRAVQTRIDDACARAGRDPAEVTTIVVTKTFPIADAAELAQLGVRDLGENRDQEASEKVTQIRTGATDPVLEQVRWHCIGQIQTNKARSVVTWADVIHSLDSSRLAVALSKGVQRLRDKGLPKTVPCLIQVSLDGDPKRGGAQIETLDRLADEVKGLPGIKLQGVMAVAPLGTAPGWAFARLREVSDALRERYPQADWISAGMSGDFEEALANGATHLRVGGAILGNRPPLR